MQQADGSLEGGVALGGGFGTGIGAGVAMFGANAMVFMHSAELLDDSPYHGTILPEIGPYPLVQSLSFPWFEGSTRGSVGSTAMGATLHELTHAFGMPHDFRNDGNFNNHLFTIRSDRLQAAAPLDPDPGTVYQIRVRSTDQGGLWTEQPLAIDPGLPLPTFLAATPDPVTRHHNLTLSVLPLGAQDPALVQVHFYRDETLLGADQNGADGWSWTGSTEGWPVGQFRFYARGQDVTGAWSELASVDGIVTSWQNPDNPFDVDGNGHVAPLDVLTIIKHRSRNNCPMSPRPSWERAG